MSQLAQAEKLIESIEGALEEASRLYESRHFEDRHIAEYTLFVLAKPVIEELATRQLVAFIHHLRRSETADAERRASSGRQARRKGAKWYKKWVEETDEGKEFDAKEQEWDARCEEIEAPINAKFAQGLKDAIDQFAADLKMEWTKELLDSEFGLPDGTLVTWGSATIAEHKARQSMFETNALANMEGAARHVAAIEALKVAGKATLNELVAE